MSEFLLLVVILSAPGFIMEVGVDHASRIRRRRSRDLFAAIGRLMLISASVVISAILLINWIGEGAADPAVHTYIYPLILPNAAVTTYGEDQLLASIGWIVLAAALIAYLGGILFGKLSVWRLIPDLAKRSVVEEMTAGLLPPEVSATVLTTTRIGDGVMMYRGVVAGIQLSPEGEVEYVTIANPTKSILELPAMPRRSPFASPAQPPRARKPFVALGAAPGGSLTRLLIESEDIANIYFDVSSATGRPDLLDWLAYLLARAVGRA